MLGIVGAGWDRVWHSRHAGQQLAGANEVLEAHWLMILGIIIIFVALAAAVRSVRQPRSAVVSTWTGFVGSVLMVAGFAWDSVCHIQGTESPTAHAMNYVGFVLAVLGVLAALVLTRHLRASPGR